MAVENNKTGQDSNKRFTYNLVIQIDPKTDRCRIVQNSLDEELPGEVFCFSRYMERLVENQIHPEDREEYSSFWKGEPVQSLLEEAGYASYLSHDFRYLQEDGTYGWREEMVLLVRQKDGDAGLFCFVRDVEEETKKDRKDNARILLPGRKEFFRKAARYLEDHGDQKNLVIAINVRNFRLYNEIFGREEGNKRLETIDHCIRERLVSPDAGIGGYLGGDDFCLVHTCPADVELEKYAHNLYESIIAEYSPVRGFSVMTGIFEVKDPHESIHYMFDCAASAIKDIEKDMTETIGFYNEKKHGKQLADQRLIINALDGIRAGEFSFRLQPLCELDTGRIIGAEALARWTHEGQVIPPGTFVPVLDKYGYVPMLDHYIWEEVIKWERGMLDRGLNPPPCSVNVSRSDFYYMDVAKAFSDLLDKYELPPELIRIEITESSYSEDLTQITRQAGILKKRGLTIMLDDFGTGYSSLEMLNEMQFDLIKADMKFMQMGQEGYDLFGFILNTASKVGVPVVSEGVETLENVEELKRRGCSYAQGYFYYQPLPVNEFEHLLEHPEEQVKVK